jgi:hypothetical protein
MVIKLPARKFTTREREMLWGAGAPDSFFYDGEGQWVPYATGFGVAVALVVFAGMVQAKMSDDESTKQFDEKQKTKGP